MSENALIIFTKNPELGKVKTRLAKSMGDKKALEVYQKLIAITQRETAKVDVDLIVYYSSEIDQNDDWHKVEKKVQTEGDLGKKMSEAFRSELKMYKKVCIIGTDCATLTSKIIINAFTHLEQTDFVLGPANDGGYYLLGMKKFEAGLFEGIKWSTELVYQQTVNKIKALNQTYHLLQKLIDVDTIEDWEMVRMDFK